MTPASTDGGFEGRHYLLRHCGYPQNGSAVLFLRADGSGKVAADPYDWGDRTFRTAHLWVEEHFDELADGDVICVETILGERETSKISERFGC